MNRTGKIAVRFAVLASILEAIWLAIVWMADIGGKIRLPSYVQLSENDYTLGLMDIPAIAVLTFVGVVYISSVATEIGIKGRGFFSGLAKFVSLYGAYLSFGISIIVTATCGTHVALTILIQIVFISFSLYVTVLILGLVFRLIVLLLSPTSWKAFGRFMIVADN